MPEDYKEVEPGHRHLLFFPALKAIYRFKQTLCDLLLKKHRTRQQCRP